MAEAEADAAPPPAAEAMEPVTEGGEGAGEGDEADLRPTPPSAPVLPERPDLEVPFASFSFIGLSASIEWLTASVEVLQKGLKTAAKERAEADEKLNARLEKIERNVSKLLNAEPVTVEVQKEAPPPLEPSPPLDVEELFEQLKKLGFVVEDDARCFATEASEGVRLDLAEEIESTRRGLAELADDVGTRLQNDIFKTHQGELEAKFAELDAANEVGNGRHAQTEQAVQQLGTRIDGVSEEIVGVRDLLAPRIDDCEAQNAALGDRTAACENRLNGHDAALEAQEARINGLGGEPPPKEVVVPSGPDPALIQAQRMLEAELERLRNLVGVLRAQQEEDAARIADLIQKEEERAERERAAANKVEVESTGSEEERRRLEAERQRQALMADLDARMAQMLEAAGRGAKNLHHAVKGIERNTERLELKVDDMWGRLPKVIAMLEPLQVESEKHAEGQREKAQAFGEAPAQTGSNKEEMNSLTKLMSAALEKTMGQFRSELEVTISAFGEDLRSKAGAGEVAALANRLDAWTQHAPGCSLQRSLRRGRQSSTVGASDRSESPPQLSRGPSSADMAAQHSPAASPPARSRFRDSAAALASAEMQAQHPQLSVSSSAPSLERSTPGNRSRELVGGLTPHAEVPASNRSRGRGNAGPAPPATCHDKCKQPTCPRSLEMTKSLGRLPKLHAQVA